MSGGHGIQEVRGSFLPHSFVPVPAFEEKTGADIIVATNLLLIIRCFKTRLRVVYYVWEVFALIEKHLGERIRILRSNTGLSQEKFALKIGMDRTYFASVENGKRNIAIRNIKKIADGLGVTLSELFEGL